MVRRELIEQIVGHIEHHGSSSRFGKEVKLNLGTMHGNVHEDFTSTSGNKEMTKRSSVSVLSSIFF